MSTVTCGYTIPLDNILNSRKLGTEGLASWAGRAPSAP